MMAEQQPHEQSAQAHHPHKRDTVFLAIFTAVQSLIVVLFWLGTTYGEGLDPKLDNVTHSTGAAEHNQFYHVYQDIHVMIFIGFGQSQRRPLSFSRRDTHVPHTLRT